MGGGVAVQGQLLLQEGLVHMARAFGYVDAEADLL